MTDITETTAEAAASGFRGWPADGLAFLAELEQDNTRGFWMTHMHRYRDALLGPTRALAADLTEEFGAPRVFRPQVDRRFRPGARAVRTDTGATVTAPGGTPYVVRALHRGARGAGRHRLFDAGQLRRYREAVDGPPGEELRPCWPRWRAKAWRPWTWRRCAPGPGAVRPTTPAYRCCACAACTSTGGGRRASGSPRGGGGPRACGVAGGAAAGRLAGHARRRAHGAVGSGPARHRGNG